MKTVNEWMETGLLEGLDESEYHDMVCLLNRALAQIDIAEFQTENDNNFINMAIFPLVRRTNDNLKRLCKIDEKIAFKDALQYLDTYHLLRCLLNRRGLFVLAKSSFLNLDTEVEILDWISRDTANNIYFNIYMISQKINKMETDNNIPSFRAWNSLQKNKKNETETIN